MGTELRPADQLIDNPSVGFVSLGCPKAMVDSERIITLLRADGYRIGKTYDDSDVIIVNILSRAVWAMTLSSRKSTPKCSP